MLDHFSLEVVFVGGNAHLRARGEGEGIVGVSTSGSKLGPEIALDCEKVQTAQESALLISSEAIS